VRKLNELVSRMRWGNLESRRRRGLERLHDLLAATQLHGRYWMTMGLLLGCVREGGPIAWDRDSDFGFMDRDLSAFLSALDVLRRNGYDLRPMQLNNDGRVTKWALKREAVKFEFFMFDARGDRIRWHYHQKKPPLELVNEIPAHGLREFELYGRRWLVPDNAEEVLTRIYGNWRKPDPDYRYWRDCGATVERHPWTPVRRRPGSAQP